MNKEKNGDDLYYLYAAEVRYNFAPDKYAAPASQDADRDQVLAAEIKSYFPELSGWEATALANAWRAYSRDVGLIDEELVCVRTPTFLGFLFVVQEGWPVAPRKWVVATDAAIKILWPDA